MRKLWSYLVVTVLLAGLLPATVAGAAGPDWSKVDPALLSRLAHEATAEFHVVMRIQADVSGAAMLKTKVEKTTYVYNLLRRTAEATQRPILNELAARGIPARSFYVYNAIAATGGLDTVAWLAARADVARIVLAPETYPDPVYEGMAPAKRVATVEWNIARIHAPDVWALGFRGEGMVVASNDSGVQYDHPALVRQYRGCLNPPACTSFDHNYNWWDGPGGYQYPHDYDGHGTHTTGTMVGEDAGQTNQIGVAPAAKWIACAGVRGGSNTVECFQFFLAPWNLQGQNPDPTKAPDAINNSWYSLSSYDYRPIIQNLNAAGIAVIKSAGNWGPGCSTITNPGYVPEIIATAAFAQGDTIATFSSRGPSDYYSPGDPYLKPEVAAPGMSVRSSYPPSTYATYNGTSVAAPHSTAMVALIWNAAPCIRGDVPLTKQIMMETAEAKIDPQCPPFVDHPNDVWGWGVLDALAAVLRAIPYCSDAGTLQGHVTEAYPLLSPGDPLEGVTVTARRVQGGYWSSLTDAGGFYSLTLPVGTYTVTAAGPRHTSQTHTGIVIVTDTVTTLDFSLRPRGLLYGYVTDADSGAPLAATVGAAGHASTTTDPTTGRYELYLDAGAYAVTAAAPNYISQTVSVTIALGEQIRQDFALVALVAVVPEPIQMTLLLGQTGTVEATLLNHMDEAYPFQFREVGGPRFAGTLGSGGPDPFGYTYKDSAEPDGPYFDWIDATDSTPLGLDDDQAFGIILPFSFTFYGNSSNQLCVSNNGGVVFGTLSCLLAPGNVDLGSAAGGNMIVPFWDNIDSETGNVYVKTVGEAPNRRFVVEWYDRPHYNGVGTATFELILYEGTNNIKYQYLDTDFGNPAYNNGASATCGILQTGPYYLQYSYDQPVLVAGLAICFQYPGSPPCDPLVPWYSTDITGGTVPAGGSLTWNNHFTATPDAGIVQPGEYHATLLIRPQEQNHPLKQVHIVMNVVSPSMGHLVGTVTGNRPGGPLEAQILIEAGGGLSWTLSTDPATGRYGYWLEEGAYTVTASASGYVPQTAVVQITAQQTTTQDFALERLAPWAVVHPARLAEALPMGQQATQTLTITNQGLLPLVWELQEQGNPYLPAAESNLVLPTRGGRAPADRDMAWAAVALDVPWLREGPISGTLSPDESIAVDVTFAADQVDNPGIYTARLRLLSNDPLAGSIDVPVTMTVLPAGSMGKLAGTVSGKGYCDQDHYPLAEASVLIEGAGGLTWTVKTQADGSYSRWLVGGLYTVTAGALAHVAAMAVVTVTVQETTTLDFALRLSESCLDVAPLAYSLILPANTRFTDTLTLANGGAGELAWELQETGAALAFPSRPASAEHIPTGDVPWVGEVPTQGVVLPDNVSEVAVIFDTSGLSIGRCYTASLVLIHDDPGWSRPLMLPLTLCVSQFTPPQASFTSNAPVCLGHPVLFTNTTVPGDPPETAYRWAFGDGEVSTATNPIHNYAGAGIYTVVLSASNGVFTDTYTDAVEVLPQPVAGFTYTIAQFSVVFTNTSQNAISYLWDFGDGFTATVANPVHTYGAAGTYTATLWAGGECGTAMAQAVLEIFLEPTICRIYLPLVFRAWVP